MREQPERSMRDVFEKEYEEARSFSKVAGVIFEAKRSKFTPRNSFGDKATARHKRQTFATVSEKKQKKKTMTTIMMAKS